MERCRAFQAFMATEGEQRTSEGKRYKESELGLTGYVKKKKKPKTKQKTALLILEKNSKRVKYITKYCRLPGRKLRGIFNC